MLKDYLLIYNRDTTWYSVNSIYRRKYCLNILEVYSLYGAINILGIQLMTKYNIKDMFDYVAGLFSGVLGAAYNSHGVPI